MAKKAAPGYYDYEGKQRWFDGKKWTDKYNDAPPPSTELLYSFTSHIDGKNATVGIFADRIEWTRKSLSGFKVVTGVGFFTGFRNKDTDLIPMKQISAVTSKRGLGVNTVVTVKTSGGSVEFRVGHKEAQTLRDMLNQLMHEANQTTVVIHQAATPAPAAPDAGEALHQLKGLLDAGVLNQEEYDTKKAELLARL